MAWLQQVCQKELQLLDQRMNAGELLRGSYDIEDWTRGPQNDTKRPATSTSKE